MPAQLIDGAALARHKLSELKQIVISLQARGVIPGLATVQVGDDPASRVYIRNKTRACAEAGVKSVHHDLPATATVADVLQLIERLNHDTAVHGIIVQLPLPKHLDARRMSQAIAVDKDVDGFNWRNLGAIVEGAPGIVPCTPSAAMAMLDSANVPVDRKSVV